MNAWIANIALSGLLLSLAVHVAALCGIDVSTYLPFVWILHVGIFIVLIPTIFAMEKTIGKKPSPKDIFKRLPRWVSALIVFLFAYTAINFMLFSATSEGGTPMMENGKYLLANRGKLIRELSASEYTALMANVARGFSGHWLLFYFLPFAWFKLRIEK